MDGWTDGRVICDSSLSLRSTHEITVVCYKKIDSTILGTHTRMIRTRRMLKLQATTLTGPYICICRAESITSCTN